MSTLVKRRLLWKQLQQMKSGNDIIHTGFHFLFNGRAPFERRRFYFKIIKQGCLNHSRSLRVKI
jgi:hypothetical protein